MIGLQMREGKRLPTSAATHVNPDITLFGYRWQGLYKEFLSSMKESLSESVITFRLVLIKRFQTFSVSVTSDTIEQQAVHGNNLYPNHGQPGGYPIQHRHWATEKNEPIP